MRGISLFPRALAVLGAAWLWTAGSTALAEGTNPAAGLSAVCAQSQGTPSQSALPVTLVGVMADSTDPSQSACLVRCAYPQGRRSASLVEIGATACDLAEITEIRPDSVVIRNVLTNRLELLTIQTADAPPQAQPPAETAPAPSPAVVRASPGLVNVAIPKASIDHYLLNLPELLSSAVATPWSRDTSGGSGAVEGFELSQIKEGSVVEKLGLKNGDVIVEVNGEKLDGLPTVLRLFGQVQSAAQAKLTVLRGGQRMTFIFNTK